LIATLAYYNYNGRLISCPACTTTATATGIFTMGAIPAVPGIFHIQFIQTLRLACLACGAVYGRAAINTLNAAKFD
jgi:hypothetical protein